MRYRFSFFNALKTLFDFSLNNQLLKQNVEIYIIG